jgi:chromate transporter
MIFLELFATFFMIGAVTFGGGYAMLPMIQEQVGLRWGHIISQQSMIDFVAVSESTPGPFAINMATYVGSEVGGVFGAFCATMGVVVPSFVIILIVAKCYEKFCNSRTVKGIMTGLKPAVVGLIGSAIISVALTVFLPSGVSMAGLMASIKDVAFYCYIAIFVLCTVLAFKKVHPIIIIVLAAVLGIVTGYVL